MALGIIFPPFKQTLFRAVSGSQQNSPESTESPQISPTPTPAQLPPYQHLIPEGDSGTMDEPTWIRHYH